MWCQLLRLQVSSAFIVSWKIATKMCMFCWFFCRSQCSYSRTFSIYHLFKEFHKDLHKLSRFFYLQWLRFHCSSWSISNIHRFLIDCHKDLQVLLIFLSPRTKISALFLAYVQVLSSLLPSFLSPEIKISVPILKYLHHSSLERFS